LAYRSSVSAITGTSAPAAAATLAAMCTSLASSPSANPVPYRPVSTSVSKIPLTKERPVEALTISIMVLGSRPNRLPTTRASAVTQVVAAAMTLFSAFIACPLPSRPVANCLAGSPSTRSTG
jgi:hypothetical protein